MTHSVDPAQDFPPLLQSLPYYVPLLLTQEQDAWLRERFPAAAWGQVPSALTRAEIRQHPWQTSRLHTSLTPFPLAAELTDLPRLARAALARFHEGETIPGEITADAGPRAWLEPHSVRLVPPVSKANPYRVVFSFVSTSPLYHTLHSCYDAIIRETEQTVRAALLEARVQQLQEQLAQVVRAGEPSESASAESPEGSPLAPAEQDHGQSGPEA